MIEKTYDEFTDNAEDLAKLALDEGGTVCVTRDDGKKLVLVEYDTLNEKIAEIVDTELILAYEKQDKYEYVY